MPKDKVHKNTFRCSRRKFINIPWRKLAVEKKERVRTLFLVVFIGGIYGEMCFIGCFLVQLAHFFCLFSHCFLFLFLPFLVFHALFVSFLHHFAPHFPPPFPQF